jgi:hypothetical protein
MLVEQEHHAPVGGICHTLTFVSVGNFFLCILLLLKNLCSSVKVKVISLSKVTKQKKWIVWHENTNFGKSILLIKIV